jgi:hypothetical protein
MFAQCGGRTSPAGINATDTAFCCPTGSECQFYVEDYWQCQPPAYTAPPESPATFNCSPWQLQVGQPPPLPQLASDASATQLAFDASATQLASHGRL